MDKHFYYQFHSENFSMHQETPTPNITYTRENQEGSNGHVHLTTDCTNGVTNLSKHQADSQYDRQTPVKFHLSTQSSHEEISDMITEGKIRSNSIAFRPYIISCVKVTDLIVYYDYFTNGKFKNTQKISMLVIHITRELPILLLLQLIIIIITKVDLFL